MREQSPLAKAIITWEFRRYRFEDASITKRQCGVMERAHTLQADGLGLNSDSNLIIVRTSGSLSFSVVIYQEKQWSQSLRTMVRMKKVVNVKLKALRGR